MLRNLCSESCVILVKLIFRGLEQILIDFRILNETSRLTGIENLNFPSQKDVLFYKHKTI